MSAVIAENKGKNWRASLNIENSISFLKIMLQHFRRAWFAYVLAGLAWHLFNENYQFGYNRTQSLPQKFFIIHLNEPVQKGDFVAFKWNGEYPYKKGQIFVKILAGEPGDEVVRKGREFFIDGQSVGVAKERGLRGQELEASPPGVIGQDQYYMRAPHKDSLDSRYTLLGLVKKETVVGRAYAIF